MKKIILALLLVILLGTSSPVYASSGFFQPNSKFYFLQPALESVKLFFTFSKEAKTDYLLQLTDRRVGEMASSTDMSSSAASRYESHFQELEKLAGEVKDKEQVAEKIKEANLRQQDTLSAVYVAAPDSAKDAILNAQENSSKNVAAVVEAVEGADKAQAYTQKVEQIQQVEKAQRVEQAPMEGAPRANPGEFTPNELKSGRELNQLNPTNSGSTNENGGDGGQVQQAQPIPMNQPGIQN